jgi:hypothetical protein
MRQPVGSHTVVVVIVAPAKAMAAIPERKSKRRMEGSSFARGRFPFGGA